jgi:hypothetical protein
MCIGWPLTARPEISRVETESLGAKVFLIRLLRCWRVGLSGPMVHQETLFVNGENLRYILGNGAGFGITALNALRQLDCCFGYLGMKGTIHAG